MRIKEVTVGTKIIIAIFISLGIVLVGGLFIQGYVVENQGVALIRQQMEGTVQQAETVRQEMSNLWEQNAIAQDRLLSEYRTLGRQKLRESTIYNTIPIVAAWTSIVEIADDQQFEFRVTRVNPRNPDNEPDSVELNILNKLKSNLKDDEYFRVDKENEQIIYAKAIRLNDGCLQCHGNPANSPTGDGKDILGYQMEGWKSGEIHGAFILKTDLKRVDEVVNNASIDVMMIMIPLFIVIGVAFGYINREIIIKPLNDLTKKLNHNSNELLETARQIALGSDQISTGASNQAAAIEETGASMQQLAANTSHNVEVISRAEQSVNQAQGLASSGLSQTDEMRMAMEEIKEASDSISAIIKTIDEIAFQTNLLALNASVEAARAGEAGQGFAVVADEVRALALRSAEAAKETEESIQRTMDKSDHGVQVSQKVAAGLQEMHEHVQGMDDVFNEIAGSSTEQNEGIRQVNQAIAELNKVVQQNAAQSEEASSIAQQLDEHAKQLDATTKELMGMVKKGA